MSELFQDLFPLARGLDAASLRHKVIAGNLANLNTPGYTRFDVKFEELLRESLRSASGSSNLMETLFSVQPKVVQDAAGPFSPTGNNVTLEKEVGMLTRNEILYNAYAEILSNRIAQLKHAISSR